MEFKIKRSIFIAMLFNICFFSCKAPVDVTEKLDTRVPSVRITYPEEECPVIRNSFTLKGVVKDDGKIEKITVTLKSTSDNTGKEYAIDCSQEKSVNSWNWKIVLNIPSEDGKFPLNDGKYSATVVAVDADGKEGKATYSFIIDNTPPMLFLYGNHCNNIKDYTGILKLGADLNFKGVAIDSTKSIALEAFVYNNGTWQRTVCDVNGEFDVKIDGFFSHLRNDGLYRSLYGEKVDAGEKTFRYALKVTDKAKEYESPTSNGEKNKGNSSNVFYFYDLLNSTLYKDEGEGEHCIFPKYSVQDVYDMMSGTYVDKKGNIEKEVQRVLQSLEKGETDGGTSFKFVFPSSMNNHSEAGVVSNTGTSSDDLLLESALQSLPVFTLNPLYSPKFEVLGVSPIMIDFFQNDTHLGKKPNVKTLKKAGEVLNIRLIPCSNDVLLEDSANFEFYYYPLSKFLKYYEENSSILDIYHTTPSEMTELIKIENIAIKKEGTSFLATFSIDENLKGGGQKDATEDKNASNSSGVASSDKKTPAQDIFDKDSTTSAEKKVGDENPSNTKGTSTKDSIKDIAKEERLKTGEAYLVIVKGRDIDGNPFIPAYTTGLNSSSYIGYAFKIGDERIEGEQSKKGDADDEAPQLLIDEVPQLVKVFPQVKGKIFDVGAGLERESFKAQVSYNNGDRFDVPIEWLGDKEKGEWKLGKFLNNKEGLYQLFFNANDKSGNAIVERVLKVELDKEEPRLVEINDFVIEGIKTGKKLEINYFQDVHVVSIGGEIKETYGIKEIKVGLKGSFDEANDKTFQTLPCKLVSDSQGKYSFLTSFDFKKEGSDVLMFKIVDLAGRVSTYEVPFVVDKTKPSFIKLQIGSKTFTSFFQKTTENKKNSFVTPSKRLSLYCEGNDEGSGIAKLEIYNEHVTKSNLIKSLLPKTSIESTENVVVSFESPIDLPFKKNKLIFCLYDNAFHVTEWKCEVDIEETSIDLQPAYKEVDILPPHINFIIPSTRELVFSSSKQTAKVVVKAEDVGGSRSGVKEVRCSKTSSFDTFSLMNEVEGNFEIELKNIQNDTVYYFMAVDNAGNFSDKLELYIKIEETNKSEEFNKVISTDTESVDTKLNRSKIDVAPVVVPTKEVKELSYNTPPTFISDRFFYSLLPIFPSNLSVDAMMNFGFSLTSNKIIATQNKMHISFRACVKDISGITSGKLTISSLQGYSKSYDALINSIEDKGDDLYTLDFNNVDILSSGEGCRVLEYEVQSSSSLKRIEQKVAIVDFTPPKITVMSIKVREGVASIRGKLIDESPVVAGIAVSGVDENSLEYKIGNSPFMKEHIVDGAILSKMENSIATWTINIPNIEKYVMDVSGDLAKYGAVKDIKEGVWRLPVQIRCKDRAGNERISDTYEIRLNIQK